MKRGVISFIIPTQATGPIRERATFEVNVAQVEEGSQELEDLPTLALCEGEDLHRRAHTGIVFGVVTPLTNNTVTLQKRYQRLLSSS